MFKYIISIRPLGFMYGSAGAFLSPENLVGRSGSKFPPEASSLSGLIFSFNKCTEKFTQLELRENLYVTGPFWTISDDKQNLDKQNFYIPIPWHKIIGKKDVNEWKIQDNKWELEKETNEEIKPTYRWQTITSWTDSPQALKGSENSIARDPWKFVASLHPKINNSEIKNLERCVQKSDGLFLENSVQLPEDVWLVYLSTHEIDEGWYRFGGENHIVEITCHPIKQKSILDKKLSEPIERSFALITPAVWGSNRLSYRYPQDDKFPEIVQMLTDKPVPYRYRAKGNLGRGRYAVPPGSVYVLAEPINKPWSQWDEAWFPKEGYSLKKVGCGFCLPVKIKGVD